MNTSQVLNNKDKYDVVLFAGGRAGSLKPLSDFQPKCLLYLGTQSILQRNLTLFSKHNVRKIYVLVGRLHKMIIEHINLLKKSGLIKDNIEIVKHDDTKYLGYILKSLEKKLSTPFIISLSDVLIPDLNLDQLFVFHMNQKNPCSATLVISDRNPINVGVVKINKKTKKVIEFIEKPQFGVYYANTAFGVFEVKVIIKYLEKYKGHIFGVVIPQMIKNNENIVYFEVGDWYHFQTMTDLHKEHILSFDKW